MRFSSVLLLAVSLAPAIAGAQVPIPDPATRPQPPAAPPADSATEPLAIDLRTRLETKLESNRNERCTAGQSLVAFTNCRGGFQPIFGVEFNILSTGTLAERFNVNLDFDSEREFEASNNISLYYQGKGNERLQRLEVGNVSFTPPPSRFITSGIPSGNYGVQAIGNLGGARLRLVAAQQKGNVRNTEAFTIGDRTLQTSTTRIEDFRFEARRFFFTIDPARLPGYPNIDILDTEGMQQLAGALPDSIRPTRLSLYRLLIGGQPPNPNGPRFIPRGARNANRGPVYEYLREGVDYYADRSLLWIALLRPLGRNERLVVAYNVSMENGQKTENSSTGGDPDLEYTAEPQYANLLWDSEVTPGDSVFNREIRSAYRIGGDELDRASLDVKIVTGSSGDQEKPLAGTAETYLQLFGLAQSSNGSTLDTENRLWPRTGDANQNVGATGNQKLIRDYFIIFPSLEPFARRGLASTGNPSNDTLYTTPTEDITSPRRPQPVYHLDTRYASEGVGGSGTFALQSIQLRRNSERVEIDGVALVRDRDYTVDYDLGRITLNRPDTLYLRPRRVSIWYEENPLFAQKPTNIFALSTEFPMANGELAFTAISQRQSSVFSRPTLGNEAASSLIAGMSGRFAWDASGLTNALQRLMTTDAPSRIAIQGELAMTRPDPNAENRAFLESFEGEGGIVVPLADARWYFSSRPVASPSLTDAITDPQRASTLVWQNTGATANGNLIAFTIGEIDPQTKLIGSAFSSAEPILWMTLLPLSVGGSLDAAGNSTWTIGGTPAGRRWRSLRTVLSPSGVDLTRVEHLEFWALVDTAVAGRRANPTVVVDVGDISENTLAFSPDTIIVEGTLPARTIVAARGKRFQGIDVLDSERDSLSRAFDAGVNDIGLAGDLARSIFVRDAASGSTTAETNIPVCRADRSARRLGDPRLNCTVRNDRLDEEDIDLDNVLNFQREGERVLRFPVDLSDPDTYSRIGGCLRPSDPRNRSGAQLCWVKVRVPISAPEANGIEEPLLRRMKTLRLTIVSSADTPDDATIDLPISGLKLAGAPWIKRSDAPIPGIAGDPGVMAGGSTGYVIATLIGTQDATEEIPYQPPPGVIEQADNRNTGFTPGQIQINERSMRLLAGGLGVNERAEAYYRFPEGQKSFMGYEQLRVWGRGRGEGWGPAGPLQFFVKIGRDADNFYLYRTPVNTGSTQNAWEPEIRVDFQRFFALKAKIQTALLRGGAENAISSCTAADSALILASIAPPTATSMRYAACDGGYMVYSVDPNVSPPDLAAVQELAVGILRISEGTMPVPSLLGDTLELWIDDIRLTGAVNEPGYAGHVGIDIRAADFWDVRANVSRRDRNYRQLAEQPTFNTQDAVDVISTFQLGKLLPGLGLSAPLTINHRLAGSNPYFMSSSDVLAEGVPGLRTPRSSATSYSLTMRRSVPLENSRFAPVFNNLSLSSTYASTGARSEYQEGRSSNFTVGVDYNIAADPRAVRLPGWLDRAVAILPDWLLRTPPLAAFRNGEYQYAPTQFRLTSALARATDRRISYARPAQVDGDGLRVDGLNFVWRNGTAIELRPARALNLRWDVSSLRDLRDYGDTSAASRARQRFLGSDVGLERERSMRALISFAPLISPWIRPNVSFGSDFTMTQDPNARSLVVRNAETNDVLPRRMNGSQSFNAGATIDIATGLQTWLGRVPLVTPLSRVLAPVEVAYTRSLLSSFDRAGDMAPLGYQFGLGGIDDFRSQNGRLASSAGLTNALTIANTLAFPLGLSLQNRFQRTDTRNWIRRLQDTQSAIDGAQRTFPDANLLWNWRPPTSMARYVSNVGARAGFRRTTRSTLAPAFSAGSDIDRASDKSLSYPLNLSVAWEVFGGLTTAGSYNVTLTESARPGSLAKGQIHEYGAEVGKTFAPRPAWRLPGDLRTRIGFQRSQNQSHIMSLIGDATTGPTSRLTDNGRYTFNLGADTEVSETVTFSLTGARTVTYDENFNRRFTQTVFSAVMNLQFFGGNRR